MDSATLNGKRGEFTVHRQTGWVQMPNGELRAIRIGVDAVNLTVYLQRNGSHHPTTPEISDDKIVQQVPLLGVSTPRRSLAPRSDFAERPKIMYLPPTAGILLTVCAVP